MNADATLSSQKIKPGTVIMNARLFRLLFTSPPPFVHRKGGPLLNQSQITLKNLVRDFGQGRNTVEFPLPGIKIFVKLFFRDF